MRTFRNRLLVLIIGLVVVAQTVTLVAVLARTERNVLARGADELAGGASLARQLLQFRAAQLATAVNVLAADFGLREAIASADRPTIVSAVANHSRRIGADLFLVLDETGQLMSSSHGETSLDPEITRSLTREAAPGGTGAMFLGLGEDVFQILAAPVRAPDPRGWVALGFRIDGRLAREVRALVDVDLAFVAQDGERSRVVAATIDARDHAAPAEQQRTQTLHASSNTWLAQTRRLPGGAGAVAVTVLKPMSDVLAPYRQLRDTLVVITALAIALAVGVGSVLGRGATRPIDRLVAGARRIERGEYDASFEVSGGEEFERLAGTLSAMQRGIAEREARITHQALHDAATGLPNRKSLERALEARIERMRSERAAGFCVVLLEVTNLGRFSASLGFGFADEALLRLGERLLHDALRDSEVARLEGARFAVVLPRSVSEDAVEWANALAERLRTGLDVAALHARLELVAGIVRCTDGSLSAAELLRRAETALERARESRLGVAVFEAVQDDLQRRRLRLGVDLPEAIARGELSLAFQSKVDFAQRRIRGAEVLARWTHPVLGAIPPDEFLPLAEQTGSVGRLTRWVIGAALDALARWHVLDPELTLAVNLTASDITDPSLPEFVLEQLKRRALPPTVLLLEITESAVMRDADAAARHMEQLRYAGLRFAIDDFGTGFSSLSQLKRLPFDELKIDKSFVFDAVEDEDAAAIVRATVQLAHSLELRVVAEGVESERHWMLLRELRCDYAQGFLIGRPASAGDFERALRDARATADSNATATATVRRLDAAGLAAVRSRGVSE